MPVTPAAPRRARSARRAALAALAATVVAGVVGAGPAAAMVDVTDGTTGTTGVTAPTGSAGSATAGSAAAAPGTAVAAVTAGDGSFVPVPAARIVDTRTGLNVPRAKVGPGGTVTTKVTGHDGVPATGVSAVVVNLTVTNVTAPGYVSLYPAGVPRPTASSINFPAGYTGANLVTVRVPDSGTLAGSLAAYNLSGSLDLVLDVVGYYSSATTTYGGYSPVPPQRAYDTRTDVERSSFPMEHREFREIGWDFGALDGEVTALAVNITVANASAGGYVTAWSGSGTRPGTSSVNFRPGVNVANFAIVQRGTVTAPGGAQVPSARFDLWSLGGNAAVIVDLVGAYTTKGHGDDARFVPLSTPTRILDTRVSGQGAPAITQGQTRAFSARSVATSSTLALAANLTLVNPGDSTYLTAWPSGGAKPTVSSVNGNAHAVVANGALIGLSSPSATAPTLPSAYNLFNYRSTANAVLDVAGLFVAPATPTTGSIAAPSRVGG